MGTEKCHLRLAASSQRAAVLMGGSQHGQSGARTTGCGQRGWRGSAVEFPQAGMPCVSDADIALPVFGNPSLEITLKAIWEQKISLYKFFGGGGNVRSCILCGLI